MTELSFNLKETCNLKYYNPIGINILKYLYSSEIILFTTIKNNNYNLTKLLLTSIEYIEIIKNNELKILYYAIDTKNNKLIYLILNYINKNTIYMYGNGILCNVAYNGNLELCKYLIFTYDLNFQGCEDYYDYSENDEYYDYFEEDYFEDIRYYTTPLYCAVESNNYKLVKFLLKLGANPNIWSETASFCSGKLPLHAAIKSNNYKIAKLLVLYGANPNKTFISIYDDSKDDICCEPIKHSSPLNSAILKYKTKFIKLFKHYCNSITDEEYLELKKETKDPKKYFLHYTKLQFNLLKKYD